MTIRAVLFDFAGVLTSSPWAALAEAGGGDLELIIGSYEEDTEPAGQESPHGVSSSNEIEICRAMQRSMKKIWGVSV